MGCSADEAQRLHDDRQVYGRWITDVAPEAESKAVEMFSIKAAESRLIRANFQAALKLNYFNNQILNGGEGGIRTRVRILS